MTGHVNGLYHKDKKGRTKILMQKSMPPINRLALEGGGSACAAYAGMFKALEELGIREEIEDISCISGGTLAGLFFALDFSADEISDILLNMPADKFAMKSESWSITPEFLATIRKIISATLNIDSEEAKQSGEFFREWLRDKIAIKLGNGRATTRDLARKIREDKARNSGKTRFKKLHIGVVNISKAMPEIRVFDLENSPEIELAELVFMSLCHPGLWGSYEWDSEFWTDGGVKSVLLSDVFDKKKYLPKGYDFTEQATNPGALSIKIDTKEEKRQVLWGVSEVINLKSRNDKIRQISSAFLDNSQVQKIREARNTIVLTDGGIDRLKLDHDAATYQEIIRKAEKTTKQYFEDYIDAVYEVKAFDSEAEWLKSMSMEELSVALRCYKDDLAALQRDAVEVARRDKLEEKRPQRDFAEKIDFLEFPTTKQLQHQIDFLDRLIDLKKNGEEEALAMLAYPSQHINIKPKFSMPEWNKKVKSSMEMRLAETRKQIEFTDREYQYLLAKFTDKVKHFVPHSHHCWRSKDVQLLVAYRNHYKNLCRDRDELENELGITCEHHPLPDARKSDSYALIYTRMMTLVKSDQDVMSRALKAVLLTTLPIIKLSHQHQAACTLTLDLRERHDRDLYLLAAAMYLKHRKAVDISRFESISNYYISHIKSDPLTVEELMALFNQNAVQAQMTMYMLENIIYYFQLTEYPGTAPWVDLNTLMKRSSISFVDMPDPAIKPDYPQQAYTHYYTNEWEAEAELLARKIAFAEARLVHMMAEQKQRLTEDGLPAFTSWRSLHMQKIVHYRSAINRMQAELCDIRNHIQYHQNEANIVDAKQSDIAQVFYGKMTELKTATDLSAGLQAVMLNFMPVCEFTADVRIDIGKPADMHLYLIAAILFLQKRNYKDMGRMRDLFNVLNPDLVDIKFDVNTIGMILKQDEFEVQESLFKIEVMLHAFESREYPGYPPKLDLNDILELPLKNFAPKPSIGLPVDNLEHDFEASLKPQVSSKPRLKLLQQSYQFHRKKFQCHIEECGAAQFTLWRSAEAQKLVLESREIRRLQYEGCGDTGTYQQFMSKLYSLANAPDLSWGLRSVMLPAVEFKLTMACGSITLDMRQTDDRNLYLLTALIFLKQRGYRDRTRLDDIFKSVAPAINLDEITPAALMKYFQEDPADVQLSMYIMQELLNYFEIQEYPASKPILNLNTILKLPTMSLAEPPRENVVEVVESDTAEMKIRLLRMEKKISQLQCAYQLKKADFNFYVSSNGFHGDGLDCIAELAVIDAEKNKLISECRDIHDCLSGEYHSELVPESDEANSYIKFYEKMQVLKQNLPQLYYGLRAVMPDTLPIVEYCDKLITPFQLRLDLRNLRDRRLFLLAGLLYLESKKEKDSARFKEVFMQEFNDYAGLPTVLPEAHAKISLMLGLDAVDTQVALFKIESMMHAFASKQQCVADMDIDAVLSQTPGTFFARHSKPEENVKELPVMSNLTGNESACPLVQSWAVITDEDDDEKYHEACQAARALNSSMKRLT